MSARAYTMKEMRAIVDYLVERKAFSEIRGRKMWMEYASSGLTKRTWQSLKETFLKRIFPDIHNPYYKLSPETIRSFREGKDVTNKVYTKLEFRNSASVDEEHVKPSTSASVAENGTGEDNIHSNLTSGRESTETIILKSTEEEIPDNSDNNDDDDDNDNENTTKQSIRDCITFIEPFTPMLREILHDFNSDEDDAVVEKDSLEERLQELTGDKPANNEEVSVKDKKRIKTTESSNNKEKEQPTTERSNNKEKDQATKTTNDSLKKSKAPVTISVTTPNYTSSKTDLGPEKTDKATVELRSKSKKSDEDMVINSDDSQNKNETKVNGVNLKPDTSVETQRSLRTRKSSKIPEESQTTTIASQIHKSEINNSVPDSLLPNNQEGLFNSLNGTGDSKQKDTADSSKSSQQNSKLSPKGQEKAITSPKAEEKTKKMIKMTLKKKTDTTEPTENADFDKEQEFVKPKDTQIEENYPIILINSESNKAATTNDKIENDIPNNIVELEPKVPEKTTPAVKEQKNDSQLDVAKEKDENLAIEMHATQSQPLSNPCLQSVSLYEEHLAENTSNDENNFVKKDDDEDILFLVSHSNSEGGPTCVPSPPKTTNFKPKRKRLLNNLFGNNKDAVKPKRRRYNSHLRDAPPVSLVSSDASSWSSTESDDGAFVSPPRTMGRYTKKYLKPVPSRLLSMDQTSGLFVVSGKKVYPVIDDIHGNKDYLAYIPEEDPEDKEVEYWKLKYVEERKKTAELSKMFEELQNNRAKRKITLGPNSPILPTKPIKINNGTMENNHDEEDNEVPNIIVAKQVEKPTEPKEEENTVKIKYAKNNEEISLEGQLPNVRVLLQDVMHLIQKERPNDDVIIPAPQPAKETEQSPIIISGTTTPEEEVRRKVTDLEESIQQEIQERDELEEKGEEKPVSNTKRKGRAKKRPATPSPTPVEPKTRRSRHKPEATIADNKSDSEIIVNEAKLKPIETEVASSPARKSSRSRKSGQPRASKQNVSEEVFNDEDSEIRYKFPSPDRSPSATKIMNVVDENYNYTKKPLTLLRQLVPLSPESTLGYQDSDVGPDVKILKKKKPLLTVGHRNKSHRNLGRNHYEFSNSDASNECSLSLPSAPQKTTKNPAPENSSISTEAYRSESYQMLMPRTKNLNAIMDQIQETSPCPNEMDSVADTNSLHLSPASQHMDSKQDKSSSSISIHLNSEPASSSSVSLPLSPELSIVENISLSKSQLNIGEQPTINEIQANYDSPSLICDKFALSQVDVTMPLMEQACQLRKSDIKNRYSETVYEPTSGKTLDDTSADEEDKNYDLNVNSNKRGNTFSETLLDKLDTVSIEDKPSFANSLDDHMKNLLLESAKKAKSTRKTMRGKENLFFEEVMEVDNAEADKHKTKQKKRCSTPRKRQNIIKSQPLLVDGIIEEETMESCASGRKSCPAVISTIEDQLTFNRDSDKSKSPNNVTVRKPKKPKQIIRVKILRPKPKKSLNKASKSDSGRMSKQSVKTDSGINDTTCSHSLNLNETVEFIHNHSETCLQMSECLNSSSLQILSPSRSVISLTTSSLEIDDGSDKVLILSQESTGLPPEMFCSKARDGSVAMKSNTESKPPTQNTNSPNECYHTPPASVSSLNSLITEDLSDEIPSKRRGDWFLLSDEDATNTVSNLVPAPNTVDNSLYNAYLKRLFPITCAVPDLSTITEASKDTDSQSRQNHMNIAEYNVNNLLCTETLSDDEFLSCQN